jgi:hypothetical protein
MLTVTIFRFDGDKDVEEGKIAWDGRRFLVKPDNPALDYILSEPIRIANSDGNSDLVYSDAEPERFLHGLNAYFCGAAVRASKAGDI